MYLPSLHAHTLPLFCSNDGGKGNVVRCPGCDCWRSGGEIISMEHKNFWKLLLRFPLKNAFFLWPPPCPSNIAYTTCFYLIGSCRLVWVLCSLPSVQFYCRGCWNTERHSSSALQIEASQCFEGGYKWLSCINLPCFDENIIFLIPLSKQVCMCVCVWVLNAKALVKPACFRMWIISQAALRVLLQCGFPLKEALKSWIFSLAYTCWQKPVGDSFLFKAEKRTSFYCKYFNIFYFFKVGIVLPLEGF